MYPESEHRFSQPTCRNLCVRCLLPAKLVLRHSPLKTSYVCYRPARRQDLQLHRFSGEWWERWTSHRGISFSLLYVSDMLYQFHHQKIHVYFPSLCCLFSCVVAILLAPGPMNRKAFYFCRVAADTSLGWLRIDRRFMHTGSGPFRSRDRAGWLAMEWLQVRTPLCRSVRLV